MAYGTTYAFQGVNSTKMRLVSCARMFLTGQAGRFHPVISLPIWAFITGVVNGYW